MAHPCSQCTIPHGGAADTLCAICTRVGPPTASARKLSEALKQAGCDALAQQALQNQFDDFKSVHDAPQSTLIGRLYKVATPAAVALVKRVCDGEFDASKEESNAWANSADGKATFAHLFKILK